MSYETASFFVMMEKAKKSGLARIPAVGLSLMTFFASLILATLSVLSTTEIIPMGFYVIVIVGIVGLLMIRTSVYILHSGLFTVPVYYFPLSAELLEQRGP